MKISEYPVLIKLSPLEKFSFFKKTLDPTSGLVVQKPKPIGEIINTLLLYIFPIAGLILFVLIIASGFQLMTSTGNPETMKKAQQRLLFAVLGFIIIFVSYWLIQILDAILGLNYFN